MLKPQRYTGSFRVKLSGEGLEVRSRTNAVTTLVQLYRKLKLNVHTVTKLVQGLLEGYYHRGVHMHITC